MQPTRLTPEVPGTSDPAIPYRRVRHLVISKHEGQPGSGPTYFVKTSAKQTFQFGEEEHLLCGLLDGNRSFPEIQVAFKQQIGVDLSKDQFDGFLTEMLECGIVEPAPEGKSLVGKLIEDDLKAVDGSPQLAFELGDDFDTLAGTDGDPARPDAARRSRIAVRLFNPAGLLRAMDWLGGPLRFYHWMLLPASFACLVACALNRAAMGADLATLTLRQGLAIAVAALLVAAIVAPVAQAAMASFLGCPSRLCGLAFRFRLWPTLRFSDAGWGELRAAQALRVAAAPLTARLALFAAATATWLGGRPDAALWPTVALVIGQVALCGALAGAVPFGATPGRKWLATLFGRRELWRSGGATRVHLVALSALLGLGCAGLALLYLSAAHAGHAGLRLAPDIPSFLQPIADAVAAMAAALSAMTDLDAPDLDAMVVPLLAVVPIASWLWLRGTVKSQAVAHVAYLPEDVVADAPAEGAAVLGVDPAGLSLPMHRDPGAGMVPSHRLRGGRWPSKMTARLATWAALILAFGCLPYAYEAGGNFVILPHDSSKLNARIQGELTEVMVNEGDRVVPGQILGILSDWDEQANLDVSKAQLEAAKANLQALYETPKPEDVELARKQYELAIAKLPYDRAQFDRASVLVKTDAVSRQNYDQILSQYQQDQAAADVARANYDDVRAGPTPAQFDAARAILRQDTATVAYNEDQLERTRIRATSYGEVVTPNPMLLRGQWFMQGALVFTVQDLSTVQADVQVPETDIGNVQLGGVTRLRAWALPETTFLGQAVAIAGDAQPDPGGSGSNIIRVRTEVPNPDGALHPSMTGFAKITGYYMPTWKACMQMIVRFFLVQIWSFVP